MRHLCRSASESLIVSSACCSSGPHDLVIVKDGEGMTPVGDQHGLESVHLKHNNRIRQQRSRTITRVRLNCSNQRPSLTIQ